MKKFMITAIVILTTCIWAQTEIEEITAQDTLNVETVIIDTLKEKIDPKLLLVELNNFLDYKRYMEDDFNLPHLIYKENFHLSSPFNLNIRVMKNGFSEIPFAIGNLQIVQNNQNIYNTIYKRGNIFYNSLEYSLPVAITETYMGLGDIDMNNISVALMKGDIFEIPNFDMQLDYLGEKGIWQGYENEVIQNFHLYLSYDLGFAKVHFDNSIIDQELPGEKDIDGYIYAMNSASYKENDYSIKVENKVIYLGLKYKKTNYKMHFGSSPGELFHKERDLMQFLVQKRIKTQNHKLDLSFELISEDITINAYSTSGTTYMDDSYHLLSVDHDSGFLGFNFGNTGYYRDENNFQLDSELKKAIFHGFSLLGEYSNSSSEYSLRHFYTYPKYRTRSRIGGGILINTSHLTIKAVLGQNTYKYSQGDFFEVQNMLDLMLIGKLQLKIESWLRKDMECYHLELDNYEIRRFPEWQMSNLLEFTYFLKHKNAIKLGFKHIYHSEYSYYLATSETLSINDTQNFDAYLKIQLTDRFEISADVINLTNNEIMFTNYAHPGTHFNFNVHWIFIN